MYLQVFAKRTQQELRFQTDDMRVDAKNQVSKLLRAPSPTSESPAQSYLSALEREEAISREFGKSVDWLLTGKAHVEPKKRGAVTGTSLSAVNREEVP